MTIKRIAFVFGLFMIIVQSTTYAADDKMATLRQYQEQQLASLASKIPDRSIELLYRSTGGKMPILVLQEHSNIHSIQELQKLFDNAELVTASPVFSAQSRNWSQKDWNTAMVSLNERKNRTEESLEQLRKRIEENPIPFPSWKLFLKGGYGGEDRNLSLKIKDEYGREKIPLSDIKLVRDDALTLLKSFLPPEHNDLGEDNAFLIKANVERRLYTYTKLYETIKAKNLNHIQLPLKFLIVKDKKTDTYITDPNKIKPILSKRIKTFISDPTMLELNFLLDDQADDYSFHIVAEKIINHKILSPAAFQELEVLVEEAPFDVGYDNIFADEQGNAVIIDTEYKGATPRDATQKLGRYGVL